MISNFGPMEMSIVAIIALLVLGPKRLPDAGRGIGRGLREFKYAIGGHEGESAAAKLTEGSSSEAQR